jgi:NADPH:quinone reductase-like Zn-dependent oxidoreductase
VRWVSGYLDTGALNNWSKDVYDWDKEIVLITGGAGGIGGHIVRLLVERGIKVVVMDVIPMTFDTRRSSLYSWCWLWTDGTR